MTVTAKDIKAPSQIEILNPDHVIAELTSKTANLEIEMTVENGLGYVPREVHQKEKVDIGTIALDAVFTPIRRVNYEVENMRVGNRTDYNRLRVFVETDGTLSPREALEKSIEIMVHQLKAIIGFQEPEMGVDVSSILAPSEDMSADGADNDVLKTRIETLDLTTRTANALAEANIRTIGGLVRKKKDDILSLDGIGPKGVDEIVDVHFAVGSQREDGFVGQQDLDPPRRSRHHRIAKLESSSFQIIRGESAAILLDQVEVHAISDHRRERPDRVEGGRRGRHDGRRPGAISIIGSGSAESRKVADRGRRRLGGDEAVGGSC